MGEDDEGGARKEEDEIVGERERNGSSSQTVPRQKHAGNTIMRFPLQENVFVV